LDQKGTSASGLFSRQLSPAMSADIGASYSRYTQSATGAVQNTVSAIATLRWQLGQRLGLRAVYGYTNVSPNGYKANQIGLIASYSLIPRNTAQIQPLQPIAPMSSQQPYQPLAPPQVPAPQPLPQPAPPPPR
jgi:GH25 family lysozyme M1 (1,4-beta-N-acetylmuramidase)